MRLKFQYTKFAEDGKHPSGYKDTPENRAAGRPLRHYTDHPDPTWKSYGVLYPSGFLKLDIDDYDHRTEELEQPIHGEPRSKTVIKALKACQIRFLTIKTQHGVHILLKAPDPERLPHKTVSPWVSALGIKCEWKYPESDDHLCLKRHGEMLEVGGETEYFAPCHDKRDFQATSQKESRKIRNYQNSKRSIAELDEVDELPAFLYPIQKSPDRPFKLDFPHGDRTQHLGGFLFYLVEKKGFTADEAFQTVRLMNQFVFEDPIPERDLDAQILNDSTYAKLEKAAERKTQHSGKKPELLESFENMLDEMGITIRYNQTLNVCEFSNMSYDEGYQKIQDEQNAMAALLWDDYRRYVGRSVSQTNVRAYIKLVAVKNAYNPIRDYLTAMKWDGQDRFPELFAAMGVTDPFDEILIRKWFQQAAALPFNSLDNPIGCEGVLILVGPEGIGKSRFFQLITPSPRWYSSLEKAINTNSKDVLVELTSYWISEIGEIDRSFRENRSDVKNLITSVSDTIRFPFDPEQAKRPRLSVFCGTSNEPNLLTLDVGMRRWWVVPVEKINQKKLQEIDLQQFWSQCFHEWQQNPECFRLTDDECNRVKQNNMRRIHLSTTEETILDALDFNSPVTEWRYMKPSELNDPHNGYNLSPTNPGDPVISGHMIGLTLAKFCKLDGRIKRKGSSRKGFQYLLPLPKQSVD